VLRALRGGGFELVYDEDEFTVSFGDTVLYLGNLYEECAADPHHLNDRVARFVRGLTDRRAAPPSWSAARQAVLPVLRSSLMAAPASDGSPRPLSHPAVPFLAELVVVDEPDTMMYVTDHQLGEWSVSADEVFATARANLAARAAAPGSTGVEAPALIRIIDEYAPSFLLLDGWLEGMSAAVGGSPVAFAADRESLLVTADGALDRLFELVETDYTSAPRAISPVAYVSDSRGRTVPYDAPPGHPLHGPARRASRILAATEYNVQAGRVADALPCHLVTRPDGSTFTVTPWERGSPALLPVVDFVAFVASGEAPLFVPWADVAPHLAVADEVTPTRFTAPDWPGDINLAALSVTP